MDYKNITLSEEIDVEIDNNEAVLLYFSAPHCNVCKVLKPKLAEMLRKRFPKIRLNYIDIDKSPKVSGQFKVFSIPTILIYFDGKEYIRKIRNFGLYELSNELEKPYSLMFDK